MKGIHGSDLDKQIVFALERISEAFRVLLWEQSRDTGLSPIQIQILIFINSHSAKATVSYLAQEFNMTKATISDSVKTLLNKGLVLKVPHAVDSRSFSLRLTEGGKAVADKTSVFTHAFTDLLLKFGPQDKHSLYHSLSEMIKGLNQKGIISVQRNCISCRFHSVTDGAHYCGLIKSTLLPQDLKTDCAEHERKA